jgi:hypothetical protein
VKQFNVIPSYLFGAHYSFLASTHEPRIQGSKHGYPASAKAAVPQGKNDQFSVGPARDFHVRTGPAKSIRFE